MRNMRLPLQLTYSQQSIAKIFFYGDGALMVGTCCDLLRVTAVPAFVCGAILGCITLCKGAGGM